MPTHRELTVVSSLDENKPPPVFNTSIEMHASFKHMVNELRVNYEMREVTVIETLLKFCATQCDYDDINDFFIRQQPPKPARKRRRKA